MKFGCSLVFNYKSDVDKGKRVLVSYVNDFSFIGLERFNRHTNRLEANEIVKTFLRFGYCVDLVSCDDIKFEPKKTYDVIFGFGYPYRKAKAEFRNTKKILYLTENDPKSASSQERLAYEKYNELFDLSVCLDLVRAGRYYSNDDLLNNDVVVALGDELRQRELISNGVDARCLLPTGLCAKSYKPLRNVEKSRYNILWFGSGGCILKGLPLLLFVVSKYFPEFNIYVAGLNEGECKKYIEPLNLNFKNLGFLSVGSDDFIDTINSCSFMVLPSYSEAASTSVLTALRHGLIPIVSKHVGLSSLDFVKSIDLLTEVGLKDALKWCHDLDIKEIETYHKKIYIKYNDDLNINKFSYDFSSIINGIL